MGCVAYPPTAAQNCMSRRWRFPAHATNNGDTEMRIWRWMARDLTRVFFLSYDCAEASLSRHRAELTSDEPVVLGQFVCG
jgi:hypothetical protein